ncbi:MAG: hypothetical protein BWK78_03205 [Thiotrichaceae bacterium IS1]|nr:MAG: hypothetical protein BWK78_03205 [Thiotrichaceae bacterium IS1]
MTSTILGVITWVILIIDLITIILLFFSSEGFRSPLFFKEDPHWKITLMIFIFSFVFLGFYRNIYGVIRNLFQGTEGNNWLSLSLILLVLLLFYWGLRFAVDKLISSLERLNDFIARIVSAEPIESNRDDEISPKKVTIMLIGPESVGKTSVLATTYHAIANDSIVEFTVRPQQDTMRILSDAYNKLFKVTEQSVFQDVKSLLEGTQFMVKRPFDIYLKGEPKLTLEFWDIPGGHMNIDEKHRDYGLLKSVLKETTVFINVLDAVALIEGDDAYFFERATPMMARYFLEEPQVVNTDKNFLVLFVVTKCEKWLKTEEGRRELQEKFDSRYYQEVKNLLNRVNGKMAGVLVPVKTLGCVEFTRFDSKTNRPIFERRPRIDCKPQFVDQPLRYALAFALSQLKISPKERTNFSAKVDEFQQALRGLKNTRNKELTVYGRKDLLD